MKVIHIISSGGMYGAEAVILNLSRVLMHQGHCSIVATFANSSNPNLQLHNTALKHGLESPLIPCQGQMDRATIAAIRELVTQTRADVVHAHGYKADIYSYLALRGRGVALVSTCHTWYDTDWMVSLYGMADRLALRGFARVVAVSDEVRQRLLKAGLRDDKIRMVRNGIDLRPFDGAAPSLGGDGPAELLVGLVGRLAWEKGVDIFLLAAVRVLSEFPTARFVVVGEGPDRTKLDQSIDELGLRETVTMAGHRDDMPSVYASFNVMVSSSRQEGLPIAILEGMASSLPLVATAVGDVTTVVEDGTTGILVPPGDVERLAAGILELLRDPAKRVRFGTAARQLVEDEYSAERMTADYLRVYDEAIANSRARRFKVTAKRRPKVFMMDLLATVPYYTAYLSQALLKQNVDLTVGSISYYLDPTCFSSRGINVDPGMLNVVGRFQMPRLPRRLLKLLEAIVNLAALTLRFLVAAPDVIHVQFLPMIRSPLPLDLWFVKLCRRRGAKIVLTAHDLLPHDTGDTHKSVYANLYRDVDALICHSDSIRARLVAEFAVPESKISVIAHGPFFYDLPPAGSDDILRSFDLKPGSTMVLWQGIIFPYKGIDILLTAWQQVEAQSENAWLVIAGTGAPDLLERIRSQVAELALKRVNLHFRFISTEELVALYRAADVVVYPYRAITTSGALATGLALGKTIVATDLQVFRELLTDGKNARLIPPSDTKALAQALAELLQDPALRERLAEQVRAMRFGDESWQSIAKKTVALYDKVAG